MALTSITKDFVVKSGALIEGTSFVTSSTGQTGTLQVNGGAAIAKNLIVGTTATIWGAQTNQSSLNVNGLTTLQGLTAQLTTATQLNITGISTFGGNTLFNGAVNTFSGALFVTGTNIFTVGTGASAFGGTVTIAGVTSVTNTATASSSGGTGALVVSGGTYIGDNLVVKSTAYNTATNTANAIYTPGGIYADGGLTVGGNGPVLFKGPVTFSGTATYVLSTNTFFTDSILELHAPPGGVYSNWTLDDGKDVGFRFHYYTNSTDTNAALVLANDTKWLEWYSAGAEGTSTFSGSTYGNFKTGGIWATANLGVGYTTAQVGEKLSVNGGVYVNGTVTATTFIGALTGTATQANNLNGGASGSLPYQSAPNVTAMLPIGTNGYILQVVGGNPTWSNVSGLTAGLSTTATNIAGGLADQIPYQSGPGQTVFSSALRFNGTTFTTTNIVVSGTTDSASYGYNTGSFITAGGASIAKSLYVGGDLNLAGNLYLKGVGLDQISGSTGTFDFVIVEGTGTGLIVTDGSTFGGITTVTNTTPALGAAGTAALQVRGGVGISKDIYVGTTATVAGVLLETNTTPSLGSASAGAVQVSGGVGIAKDIYVGTTATIVGNVNLTNTDPSLATSTAGALRVSGGVGINKDIYVGTTATISGITYHNNTTPSLASATGGAVQTQGGLGIAKDIYVGTTATIAGNLLETNTTPTLGSATAGAVQVSGGVGIAKDIYVGTTATFAASASVGTTLTVTGYTTLNGGATISAATVTNNLGVSGNLSVTGYTTVGLLTATIFTATTANILGNETVSGNLTVTGYSTFGLVTATQVTATSLTVIGNETVSGTLAVTGYSTFGLVRATDTTVTNLTVTGTATLPSSINITNLTVTNLTVTSNETVGGTLTVTGLTALNGGATTGIFTATGITRITDTTDSNAITNGALIVSGGVGIAKSLVVGEDVTVGSATTQTVFNSFYSNNTLLSNYTSGHIVTNSAINLDTWSSTAYRTAKYLVQIVDGTKIHVQEMLVFHDGTNVYMTEYAIATSQGELGTFDAGLATNTITVTFTANYTPTLMTIKMTRQTITL